MKKLAVFDLDGTLNRTDLFSVPAHLKALAERGITDVTEQKVISTFGERADEYVKILLGEVPQQEARRYLDDVAKYELEFIAEYGRPYDGVTVSLSRLREDGYRIAVCSNSSLRYQTMVLTNLKLMPLVDTIQDLRPGMTKIQTLSLLLKKEKPDAAVMVGDRKFDIEAGRENGLPTIGCKYGFNPQEADLADIVINSAFEIYDAVQQLISCSENNAV